MYARDHYSGTHVLKQQIIKQRNIYLQKCERDTVNSLVLHIREVF